MTDEISISENTIKYAPSADCPIGVIDSGMGGISTLRELIARMPEENFLYFGDDANAPYGTKSAEQVCELTEACVRHLFEQQVKAVVIACNTATGAAAAYLRKKYPHIKFIGAEPALKPAISESLKKTARPQVLVMATPLTLKSEKFDLLAGRFSDVADILRLPCPGLVEFVEQGILDSPELDARLHELLDDYIGKIDSVVLGCTHYPFLRSAILNVIGDNVPIYDGNSGIAAETKRQLLRSGLLASRQIGSVRFETSAKNDTTVLIAQKLLSV